MLWGARRFLLPPPETFSAEVSSLVQQTFLVCAGKRKLSSKLLGDLGDLFLKSAVSVFRSIDAMVGQFGKI